MKAQTSIFHIALPVLLLLAPLSILADDPEQPIEFDAELIGGALDGDIFTVFPELAEEYDTPLKRRHFLKTPEGRSKVEKAKLVKAEVLATWYYIEPDFQEIGQYDLDKGRFRIRLGFFNSFMAEAHKRHHRLGGCHFPQVPITRTDAHTGLHFEQFLNLAVPENEALLVEKDYTTTVRLVFKVRPKTFATKAFNYDTGEMEPARIPQATDVQVQLISATSGEVYFAKNY